MAASGQEEAAAFLALITFSLFSSMKKREANDLMRANKHSSDDLLSLLIVDSMLILFYPKRDFWTYWAKRKKFIGFIEFVFLVIKAKGTFKCLTGKIIARGGEGEGE